MRYATIKAAFLIDSGASVTPPAPFRRVTVAAGENTFTLASSDPLDLVTVDGSVVDAYAAGAAGYEQTGTSLVFRNADGSLRTDLPKDSLVKGYWF